MTSKQELRDEIERVAKSRDAWRQKYVVADSVIRDLSDELQATRAELDATRKQRDAAVDAQHVDRAELVELRARVAELEAAVTTPEPRPFRVGDRVRVAEGATCRVGMSGTLTSKSSGQVGVVREVWSDGDLIIDTEAESGCAASPEFCTLIEGAPDDDAEQATADLAAEPRTLTITVPAGVAIEWSLR